MAREGTRVFLAEDGEKGIELSRAHDLDCILLDYILPGLNGLEVLAKIKETEPSIKAPVIMMTGEGDERIAVKAMKQGASDYLIKGETTAIELNHAVDNAIEKFSLRCKLEEKQQEIEAFTYTAAHDIKAPLRIIESFSKILKTASLEQDQGKIDECTDMIIEVSARMSRLVDDLLEYTRAGRSDIPHRIIDLNKVVDFAICNLPEPIKKANGTIEKCYLPAVKGESSALIQLFQNLIANALKYHESGQPELKVSSKKEKNRWLIGVQDNGIGIAPEHFQLIFAPFQRLHGKNKYEGSGIGLSTCKKIVNQHKGEIWVESTLGKGTTFWVSFPIFAVKPTPQLSPVTT